MPDIWFPYLGIEIEHLSKIAFTIGNLSVAWYGVLISCGVICGLLLARVLAKKSGQDPDFYTDFLIYALIIGLLGGIISQFGDLTASVFKRKMGIKDYGNLIPGHGGILDRFDSVLFTGPLVFYYLMFLTETAL